MEAVPLLLLGTHPRANRGADGGFLSAADQGENHGGVSTRALVGVLRYQSLHRRCNRGRLRRRFNSQSNSQGEDGVVSWWKNDVDAKVSLQA